MDIDPKKVIESEAEFYTFEQLAELEPGTILVQRNFGLLKGLIVRGPASLCAYIGIPLWHPLRIAHDGDVDLDVHGGLTFAREGDNAPWPDNAYWFGWDYAHFGDFMFYYVSSKTNIPHTSFLHDGNKWTVPEVYADLEQALHDFMPIFIYGWVEIVFRKFLIRLTNFRPANQLSVLKTLVAYNINSLGHRIKTAWLNRIKKGQG